MTRVTRSRVASMALLCLYQHRLMSTGQLYRLLLPGAASSWYLRRELGRLRADGLVDAVTCGSPGQHLWFVTDGGAAIAEQSRQVVVRSYRMNASRAAGPLKDHMLAVNETGLAFAAAACSRGDTCGPLGWLPEVAHHLGGPRRPDRYLIPDALLTYVLEDRPAGTRTQLQWFLEADRATMPVARLAAKLSRYAAYRAMTSRTRNGGTVPAWRSRYPVFPRLLIVLDGAGEETLERRMADLAAYTAADLSLRGTRLAAGVTTLASLAAHGPFAPVVRPLAADRLEQTDALLGARPRMA